MSIKLQSVLFVVSMLVSGFSNASFAAPRTGISDQAAIQSILNFLGVSATSGALQRLDFKGTNANGNCDLAFMYFANNAGMGLTVSLTDYVSGNIDSLGINMGLGTYSSNVEEFSETSSTLHLRYYEVDPEGGSDRDVTVDLTKGANGRLSSIGTTIPPYEYHGGTIPLEKFNCTGLTSSVSTPRK